MACYVRSGAVVSRVIAGETLIVPVRNNVGDLASIYSLNDVASTIWNFVTEPRTSAEIAGQIRSEFDADEAALENDVSAFLAEMCSAGLIAEVGAAA